MDSKFVIDVHCHTFNAEDLPMYGFLNKVYLRNLPDNFPIDEEWIKPIARFLTSVANFRAPGWHSESVVLRHLLWKQKNLSKDGITSEIEEIIGSIEADSLSDEIKMESIEEALVKLEGSENEGDQKLYEKLIEDLGLDKKILLVEGDKNQIVAKQLFSSDIDISRLIEWVFQFLKYRYAITRDYLKAFYGDNGYESMAVPLLIDYDKWVEDRPDTKIHHQLKLMELNIKYHEGRLLPFVPFDPWKEVINPESKKGSMYWVKKAIEKHGFIGVKLYPPMGYRVYGNTYKGESCSKDDLDFCGLPDSDFPKEAPHDFGRKLDQALLKLYDYCLDQQVPITIHCSNSNGTGLNYSERANPKFWTLLFQEDEKYKKLKINLGHFGGGEWVLDIIGNQEQGAFVPGIMSKDNNIYVDISFWARALRDGVKASLISNFIHWMKINECLKDRLMYGSDFIMLGMVENHEEYINKFVTIYMEVVKDNEDSGEDLKKFLYKNAGSFLGLYTGDKTRERLDLFHNKNHNLEKYF